MNEVRQEARGVDRLRRRCRVRRLFQSAQDEAQGVAAADSRYRKGDQRRRRDRGSAEVGQPSYLTPETGSGSTIRIDRVKSADNQVAVFFHCQTDLVETFRELYPKLSYSGNRAILLDADRKLPEAELRHCVALALTYHLRKRKPTPLK